MAIGKIKDLYPPGNNGSKPGTGQLVEETTGTVYSFQTPLTTNIHLNPGQTVSFDLSPDQVVTGIRLSGPSSNSTQ